jgi:hypothetical protein
MAAHLAPPPGAPDTKGRRVLVFDESPAILSAAAASLGAGRVEAITSDPFLAALAKDMAGLNGQGPGPEILPLGPPPWPKSAIKAYSERYGLIVANHSALLAIRAIKALASWLEPGNGRIIISGVLCGAQSSHLVKAASKAGLALVETSMEGRWAVMTMAPRRLGKASVWEWRPGDWLAELDEDDREAIARVEALDKSGRAAKRQVEARPGFDDDPRDEGWK